MPQKKVDLRTFGVLTSSGPQPVLQSGAPCFDVLELRQTPRALKSPKSIWQRIKHGWTKRKRKHSLELTWKWRMALWKWRMALRFYVFHGVRLPFAMQRKRLKTCHFMEPVPSSTESQSLTLIQNIRLVVTTILNLQ